MEGGADSGFRRVLPEVYQPRLFEVKKEIKQINVTEVPLKRNNLRPGDVFILDMGLHIYQWNGKECSHDEKFKAAQYIQKELKAGRKGDVKNDTLEEGSISTNHPFYVALPVGETKQKQLGEENFTPTLLRLSNTTGVLVFETQVKGKLMKSHLSSDDVFIADTGMEVLVWVGAGASIEERKNALFYGSNYLNKTKHPCIPITCCTEGKESKNFNEIFG